MYLNALFIQLCYLMHEGEFAKMTGLSEAACQSLPQDAVFTDSLLSLLAAIGNINMGNQARSEEYMKHAAELLLADGMVYLLAVYHWMLQEKTEGLVRNQYPEHLSRFLEIKERFLAGYTNLNAGISQSELPVDLTEREREVALLAASGLRNSEIAGRLFVSESTVRAHLRTIFQKLDIDRRARLAEKLH